MPATRPQTNAKTPNTKTLFKTNGQSQNLAKHYARYDSANIVIPSCIWGLPADASVPATRPQTNAKPPNRRHFLKQTDSHKTMRSITRAAILRTLLSQAASGDYLGYLVVSILPPREANKIEGSAAWARCVCVCVCVCVWNGMCMCNVQ